MTDCETLTVRSPLDVLALVPRCLGFHPQQSVVLLAFGGIAPFQVRVDLTKEGLADLPRALVAPVINHAASQVALLFYTDNDKLRRAAHSALGAEFSEIPVELLGVWQVSGDRFRELHERPGPWHEFDLAKHPFLLSAAVYGTPPFASREALRESLRPDPQQLSEVAACAAQLRTAPHRPRRGRKAIEFVQQLYRTEASSITVVEWAQFLLTLGEAKIRDAVVELLNPPLTQTQTDWWRTAVAHAPDELVAAPASFLALSAWLDGNGALASCAVDLALASDPPSNLAAVVARLLAQGTSPRVWTDPAC